MMEQVVRYQQRNCTDRQKIENFILRSRIGVLGMNADPFPYAVPVNYVWHQGSIYFHGMGSGKKDEILARSPAVCFTISEEIGTVVDPVPCHADTAYMSVMVFGEAVKVTDVDDAAAVLQILVEKLMPKYYSQSLTGKFIEKYRSSHDNKGVSVYRITPRQMTAKENAVDPDKLFKGVIL